MQTSTYFRRDVLEKDRAMLQRVAAEAYHTHKRMHAYPFHRQMSVERVPDRSCGFMCSYTELCTTELFGGNPVYLRRKKYSEADPLEYYQDDRWDNKLG